MQKLPVYVISLKNAIKRRELISSHLSRMRIEFEFIDAIQGSLMDERHRQTVNPRGNLSNGALGCYLSHVAVYERMVEADISAALVLEDDTVLHESVKLLLDSGCQTPDFDYCFLMGDDHGDEGYVYYDASKPVQLSPRHKAYPLSSGPYCTGAYIVTLAGAKKRLACAIPARTAIDHYRYLPYRPRFMATIPMVAHMNDQWNVSSISSANWSGLQQHIRRYPWFYSLRDFIKLKYVRKLFHRSRAGLPKDGQWQIFSSAVKVVSARRLK